LVELQSMIMKIVALFASTLLSLSSFSQGRANQWYFGTFAHLDFNSGSPVVGSGPMTTTEGTASISDPAGTLLFYTNGVDVYKNSHTVMLNGSGLMGDVSTAQSAMIFPLPGSATQFYIFTVAPDGGTNGLTYSIVDMTLDGGTGDVSATKNVNLTDSVSEKICAIKDNDSDNYWVVVHKWGDNAFYAYNLSSSGLSAPVVTNVGTIHSTSTFQNTYGQMKFSMCGDKIATALGYMDTVELYDFDINTGIVSNPIILPHADNVYGVEFSPQSDYLYATCYDAGGTLAQFDITSGIEATILASKIVLSTTADLYGMQIGPDKKIYVSRSFGSTYLGQIADPDSLGALSNYTDNAIDLDPTFSGNNGGLSLPSFPQSFLANNIFCPGTGGISDAKTYKVVAYPNPSDGAFTISSTQCGSQETEIFVYNSLGKLMEKRLLVTGEMTFGENYSVGIYLVTITNDAGSETIKLVKK